MMSQPSRPESLSFRGASQKMIGTSPLPHLTTVYMPSFTADGSCLRCDIFPHLGLAAIAAIAAAFRPADPSVGDCGSSDARTPLPRDVPVPGLLQHSPGFDAAGSSLD